MRIEIKPLSVNQAWQGRRFKTPEYKQYEADTLMLLPDTDLKLSDDPIDLDLSIGVSSPLFDVDNALKPLLDVLQKKYEFNDRYIYRLCIEKKLVDKGREFIDINFSDYKNEEV